jgi:hypothetical protein
MVDDPQNRPGFPWFEATMAAVAFAVGWYFTIRHFLSWLP